jgi:SP family sugar:H+ symporter-like MFS transporter
MGPVGMAVTPGTLAVIFGTAPLDREGQPRLSGAAGPVALVVAKLYVFAFGMSWARWCGSCWARSSQTGSEPPRWA